MTEEEKKKHRSLIVKKRFQSLLKEQKKRLQEELLAFSKEVKLGISVDSGLALPAGGNDLADRAMKELVGPAEACVNNRLKRLWKIEEALQRIANGTYGICEECDQPIDPRRLQITPIANLCVACKEKKERQQREHLGGRGTSRRYFSSAAYA